MLNNGSATEANNSKETNNPDISSREVLNPEGQEQSQNTQTTDDPESKVKELRQEISSLEEQLENLKKSSAREMRQAYLDVEEFFYTVSHELKSPLREIELYAKFVEEDNAETLSVESVEDLRSIQKTCDKVIEMIQSFMEYSKADKKVLNREVIKMKPLIRDCFQQIIKTNPARKVDLAIPELPDIIGDMVLIRQMVYNILSNCVKFTENISDSRVRIYFYEEAGFVSFCFEDNGIGFDMKYESDIFEIFGRVHNESDFEGYGIGLATVKKIVERFDGSVEIFSTVNKGCVVTVKFPKSMTIPVLSATEAHEKKKDKVLIGVLGALSGDYSAIAPCRKQAYELAVDEINASGGIAGKQVELLFRDFQSDAALSAEMAWELTEIQHVDVLMGGQLSSAREEIRKVADKTETLYFFEHLYENGVADHYTFGISAVPEQNLYPMLKHLTDQYGKRCYIITADYNYGILTAENAKYYIQKIGGELLAVEYFPVTKSNFDVTIENIKEAKPDILLSFCVSNNHNNFYRQWYEQGLQEIPVVSTIGIGLSYLHRIFPPPTMANTYFMSSFAEELETPNAKEFRKKIRERHPASEVPYIEFDAETAYTSVYLYKNAVELAGTTDTENVIKALESGKVRFDGPGGMVTVRGEDHHTIRDLRLFRVDEKNEVKQVSLYPGVYSSFVEKIIKQEIGVEGGLKKCGLNAPNIQYNRMFYRIV